MKPHLPCLLAIAILRAGVLPSAGAEPVQAAQGSIFPVEKFTSLGVLRLGPGQAVTFDTGDKETAPAVTGAVSGAGQIGLSQSGQVEVAVFAFDSISIARGAEVKVTGRRSLVLVASGTISIADTIDVSGASAEGRQRHGNWIDLARADGFEVPPPGDPTRDPEAFAAHRKWAEEHNDLTRAYQARSRWTFTAAGGPGGEGGEEGTTFASNPPPAFGGHGGPGLKDAGVSGAGHGGGFNRRVKGGAAGGGGGYGGPGGASSIASSGGANGRERRPMRGGVAYGEAPLPDLFGGSGGGGGSNDRAFENAGGGGGGGALSLVSRTSISIASTGRLLANGGHGGVARLCGGGGSGGAILLAAPRIELEPGAVVSAGGGRGGSNDAAQAAIASGAGRLNDGSGGGGGGGRVAFYSGTALRDRPPGVSVSGGKGGSEAAHGADGTFHSGRY